MAPQKFDATKRFRHFSGSNGEALQDSFVLSVLHGKESGFYLEIGSSFPQRGSNTYLLETRYKWTGLSIDIDQSMVGLFNDNRKNEVLLGDATNLNYELELKLRSFPSRIDYLQLDIDPPTNTLLAMKQLPLKKYRFSVITFEHDLYASDKSLAIKQEASQILTQNGYVCVVSNLQTIPRVKDSDGTWKPFEDWWIDEELLQYYSFGFFDSVRWIDIFAISRRFKMQVLQNAFRMRMRHRIKMWLRTL